MNVYFYFGIEPSNSQIFHPCVCLAEGFNELGIISYSDFPHSQKGINKGFLINSTPEFKLEDADVVLIHYSIYDRIKNADDVLLKLNKKSRKFVSVFLDDRDGVNTPGFRKGARSCDFVLKCHYNRKYKYPQNFHPWQFGVCNRILNAVYPLPFKERQAQILVNFRAKHQLRDYVSQLIEPIFSNYIFWNTEHDLFSSEKLEGDDLLFWKQTGARHYPEYYNKLSSSTVCACYGGVFAIPVGNKNKYTARIAREINNVFRIYQWDRVRQWDSWRLWEAWAAACCVIHVDLEKYGCVLPVMPENGKHYIGIDIKNVDRLDKLLRQDAESLSESSVLGEIAANGREFVLENYTPQKVAERLLSLINF